MMIIIIIMMMMSLWQNALGELQNTSCPPVWGNTLCREGRMKKQCHPYLMPLQEVHRQILRHVAASKLLFQVTDKKQHWHQITRSFYHWSAQVYHKSCYISKFCHASHNRNKCHEVWSAIRVSRSAHKTLPKDCLRRRKLLAFFSFSTSYKRPPFKNKSSLHQQAFKYA